MFPTDSLGHATRVGTFTDAGIGDNIPGEHDMATDTLIQQEQERGIETRGIERVPPTRRHDVNTWENFTMWLSANLVLSTVTVGALAIPVFQMGFWDSVCAIVLFNVLGVLPVAFFSTLGPKLGLRQMTISRFSFGWFGAGIMALFNVAACIGWSAVNVVIGAKLISQLSHLPNWVGILIIAALTTVVSLFGYAYVHKYERYAWIPMAVIFVIVAVIAGPHVQIVPTPAFKLTEWVAFLSFGAAVYGFATGWSSYAADYNVNQPEGTPTSRVFWLTFFGVVLPCAVLEVLGLMLSTAFKNGTDGPSYLAAALQSQHGFGAFLLILLALSIIANNIPNDYSLGLSMQVLGRAFQKVNRAVWTLIGAIVYVLIALTAPKSFNNNLADFLLVIAYWLGPWSIILILEHFVIRKGKYNVEDWDTRQKLPLGWAAILSMALGLVGVYLGASQTEFTGPIAKKLGNLDVGFELGIVIAAVSYLILRPIERKSEQQVAAATQGVWPPPPIP
jgi:NCS1 nucleoside transporter family